MQKTPLHLIQYTARAADGRVEMGIARVASVRERPSWQECAYWIPGFIRGVSYLGKADN